MLNTSFCRCKTLLKLSQNALSADLARKIESRCYSTKVIFSSESPHDQKYENTSSNRQERKFNKPNLNPEKSQYEKKRQPNHFNNEEKKFRNKFSDGQSHRKKYSHGDDSNKVGNKARYPTRNDEASGRNMSEAIEIFDTKYAFLDKSEKIRIKPRSPHSYDDNEEIDFKPGKTYKRNYKIINNPSYSTEVSYEQDGDENRDDQLKSSQADNYSEYSDSSFSKKYSFDSTLVFEEETDSESPLKFDMETHTENDTSECIVDTTNVNSSTGSTSITTSLRPRPKIIDTPEGPVSLNLADDEFDLNDFVKEFNEKMPGPLDECTEDISYFGPDFPVTFNFAAYADKSKLIQQYVKLGVKLYKVEKNMDHMRALLTVDLEKELPMYIQFLHDCGIPANCLGDAITENPMILKEDLDDMKTRIRYLRAHNFTPGSIARIVTKNPSWLVWATKYIDERLGHFQNEFKLGGSEMRFLATKAPKLITYKMRHINENTFAVREQMGFNRLETKLLLLYKPRLWMNSRKKIVDSFDYLHNTMKLSHVTIASQADVMTSRRSRIKNRHEFLVELKKAQYDPKKPGYIAPRTMVIGSDAEFCTNVAKCAVDTYNLFLKTR